MSGDRTILNDCDRWSPIPEWAFDHPRMTPRAFQVFALLILWADKRTGLTYNVKRMTIAKRLGLTSKADPAKANTHPVDDALKVLKAIGCVEILKVTHPVLDANGQQALNKQGKPSVWWGPSQYKVILSPPTGWAPKEEYALDPKSSPGWAQNCDEGGPEILPNIQEHFHHSISTETTLPANSQASSHRESTEVLKLLNGRKLPRSLPCEPRTFIAMMQQMSRECFHGESVDRITDTNYGYVKRYSKEIVTWLLKHAESVDPAFLYAFAHYYYDNHCEKYTAPKPVSFVNGFDDDDFWTDEWMPYVKEYRAARKQDPTRVLFCRRGETWGVAHEAMYA